MTKDLDDFLNSAVVGIYYIDNDPVKVNKFAMYIRKSQGFANWSKNYLTPQEAGLM